FFFFQAEDGIRDYKVTGVQTCALPIFAPLRGELAALGLARRNEAAEPEDHIAALCDAMRHLIAEQQRDLDEQRRFFARWIQPIRSEERRVGKECRSRGCAEY